MIRGVPMLAAALLAVVAAGCKKEGAGQAPKTLDEGITQLREALVKANPTVQSNLYSGVVYHLRYGQLMEAMAAMDQIVNDPSLTEPQKKLAGQVIDLLKQQVQPDATGIGP